jgi:hypothetical protein
MQAGKDVYCEKPMTKFIGEGRAVADAARRYGRMFQIGTFGRFGMARYRKLVAGKVLGTPLLVRMIGPKPYNWKVRAWSGRINQKPQPVPKHLNYDMWLGPAPFKPYFPHRTHGSFRGYWDYDGGGYTDMGHHYWDPVHYAIGMDNSGPVEIEADALWPAHDDAIGMWGTITYTFPGDIVVRCVSGEWGKKEPEDSPWFEGPNGKIWRDGKCEPADIWQKVDALPNPPPLESFGGSLWSRKDPGGNAEASHRVASTMHLGNIAIRMGRRIRWDPVKEQVLGDDEADRLVNTPMRKPWHL